MVQSQFEMHQATTSNMAASRCSVGKGKSAEKQPWALHASSVSTSATRDRIAHNAVKIRTATATAALTGDLKALNIFGRPKQNRLRECAVIFQMGEEKKNTSFTGSNVMKAGPFRFLIT